MKFSGRRVLVVEDEFLISLVTQDALEGAGCIVVGPAARIADAMVLVRREQLDAAILDIDLSGEMVWPVAIELLRRNIPVLFLSAYAQMNIIPAQFASFARLDKPLETHQLVGWLGALWTGER